MRRWTLLSFLGGALLALLVVSTTHKPVRPTALPAARKTSAAKPMVPGAASLAPELVPMPAKTPTPPPPVAAAPPLSALHPNRPVQATGVRAAATPPPTIPAAITGTSNRDTIAPRGEPRQQAQTRVRMERDPKTGELRPCLETTTNTAAASLPTPPMLVAEITNPAAPPVTTQQMVTAVLRSGTVITVRLTDSLSSKNSREGDNFTALLEEPLIADGVVIAPAGTQVDGRIIDAEHAAPLKGLAHLSVVLTALHTASGVALPINTMPVEANGKNVPVVQEAKKTAGALLGGSVRLIAGRAAGSAARGMVRNVIGNSTALVTGGRSIVLTADRPLRFRLLEPVTVTEAATGRGLVRGGPVEAALRER